MSSGENWFGRCRGMRCLRWTCIFLCLLWFGIRTAFRQAMAMADASSQRRTCTTVNMPRTTCGAVVTDCPAHPRHRTSILASSSMNKSRPASARSISTRTFAAVPGISAVTGVFRISRATSSRFSAIWSPT